MFAREKREDGEDERPEPTAADPERRHQRAA
jgi:hypothetical protein